MATPVGDLQWRLHGRHTYYLNLNLEGINGHERVTSSNKYEHFIGAPSGGIVVEIPTNTDELVSAILLNMIVKMKTVCFDIPVNYRLSYMCFMCPRRIFERASVKFIIRVL